MHQLTKTDLQKLNADLQHQPDAAVLSRAIQTNGINNAATPAAMSSLTVNAPARQTTRSAHS